MGLDFNNTETAFAYKTDKELKKTYRLFKMMSNSTLVNMGSAVLIAALKLRLPFVESIVKRTIFGQFCGGISLHDSMDSINALKGGDVLTVLDYGTERLNTEADFNAVKNELMNAIAFAEDNRESIPVIAIKFTALTARDILKKLSAGEELSGEEERRKEDFIQRVDSICKSAAEKDVHVFIDAEESWIQDAIDDITIAMNEKYNKESITVYQTYQAYRTRTLDMLKADHERALEKGYILGAKVVRGAYIDKERERARIKGYEDPINPTKEATDKMFNDCMKYCVENYKTLASCCATHNRRSSLLYAGWIKESAAPRDHHHLNYSQLYGMSDAISFNLAEHGYNVAKYLPYGKVREVIPYLIRRAEENTSVTGDMGRELEMLSKEMKRRGL